MSGLPPGIRHVATIRPRREAETEIVPALRLRHVEEPRVAARVEAVRAGAGREEARARGAARASISQTPPACMSAT